MEKMVPRGLITSGPLDSLTGVCIGFHVGAWRVISKSGLGSGQGSGSSHTRLQNRPWCSNRLSQAMPYRITLTVRTGLPQGSRRLGAGVLGGVRKLPIENRVHWVRDVTFDEDRSQIRTASAPQVMAALRNLTTTLVRWAGHSNVAAALRRHAAHLSEALALLGIACNPGK